MEFDDYLMQKKIDPAQFRLRESALYNEWKSLFEQLHPESFTTLKKFLINNVRRKHPLR
jgi:hypothetical protein